MATTHVRTNLALKGGLRLNESADFPAGAKPGQTCFKAGVLYVRGEVGGVSAWFPINAPQGHYVHVQGAAAQVWEVNHGFTGENVAILAYADNGDAIPATVVLSNGMASIDVGSARTGYAVVFGLAFASVAQGAKADSAIQSDDLSSAIAPISTAKIEIMEREVITAGRLSTLENSAYTQRWPQWNEVGNKPTSFTPTTHNHDGHHAREADLSNTLTQLADAFNQGAANVGAITIATE